MIWVGWRQQRVEALIAAALLAVLAAVAIPVGIHMASVYTHEGLAACAKNGNAGICGLPEAQFLIRFNGLNLLFGWATLVPALAALLFAAPFVLDLDNGTYRLYWTQSITRRRWIATKLGLGVVASVVVAGCVIALAMWSRAPIDHLNGHLSGTAYDAEGIVPIADALFVLGVAVAIGALWRRAVPALLISFAVYVVGRAFMDGWLRQRLVSPVTTTWPAGRASGPNLNQALVIDQFASDRNGHRLAGAAGPFSSCVQSSGGPFSHTSHCVQVRPVGPHTYMTAIYQPASRFWELQGVEFGIVAGIGVLLIVAAAWWTNHRIA
jgi:hypothetical protein